VPLKICQNMASLFGLQANKVRRLVLLVVLAWLFAARHALSNVGHAEQRQVSKDMTRIVAQLRLFVEAS